MAITLPVYILDKEIEDGDWVVAQLQPIGIDARRVANVSDLLDESELRAPAVCMVALRPPVAQVLALVRELTQEPRFARTAFILLGPVQSKRAAFEAGADDYIVTPPDVIELRKRIRLYLDRAQLELRLVDETRITQEMAALSQSVFISDRDEVLVELPDGQAITLMEHAALIAQERNQLDAILRYAGDAIMLIGTDGTLHYANPAWEILTGHPASMTVGQQIDWPPVTADAAVGQAIATALARGDLWQGDVRYVLPDGRELEVALTAAPAFDLAGDLIGTVVVQRSIREHNNLHRSKSNFLADAAFQVRTPVTNIKMRQYLLRQAPPEQRAMHMQALERETDRLSSMVDAMLELSRMDSGAVEMAREAVDLNRLVADVMVRFGPAAEEKPIALTFRKNASVPPVVGDPAYLNRAICVLVDNAIQYTPGGGRISLHLDRVQHGGRGYVTVTVSDTGIGIEPEAVPHLFERFFRSERAHEAGLNGVGLGLAIADEIITRHDGVITVESDVKQGSVFTIWLPLDRTG
ncbi:MAG: PAS domain-containing protein [Chloroflexi bacterium]|nr:PAS domain-containing protein [Chloroflexota bacterium]